MIIQDTSLLKDKALINGQWVTSNSGKTFSIVNPASGQLIAEVAECGQEETRKAIDAAYYAQKKWRRLSAKDRSKILKRWFDLVMSEQESLALILTAEQGKPLAEAREEIAYAASYIEWFSEEAKRVYGDTIPGPSNDKRLLCIKQPVGVVACITPWNFPSAMLARKLAPALAAGCSVVCKPANETPLSAFALAELAERAGLPAGVINIVVGNTAEIGAELTSSSRVSKLTFTGSTKVGKQLIKECAQTVKRTSMELGGNAPFIVFDDADIGQAIAGLMISKFRNAGQTCVCANRIFVQDAIYDEFVEALVKQVKNLRVGYGLEEGVTIGPLIHQRAANSVLDLIDDSVSRGAKLVAGDGRSDRGEQFILPSVLTNVTDEMRVAKEEIFGPVAPILRFTSEQEVIDRANDTEVGLACYFYTRDISRVWRVSEALEYGMVGINEGRISNEMAPFGGIKESGQGREGSKYGLDDYLEIKFMCMGGIES